MNEAETGTTTVIENNYTTIYDFEELLQELRLLREDLLLHQEQQEIYYYENLNYLNEINITSKNTSTSIMFILISFLIFSGIIIGYVLGKRD